MLNQPETKQEIMDLDFTKVLVVDDMPDNRMLMEFIFKNTSYNLTIASSASEALEKAQTELPVLIVSDIQMPTISGLDLLENLKANDRTKDIAVILVTAHYRDSQQVTKGFALGAEDYIQRPFMPDEFLSRVDAVIRTKRAEAEARLQAHTVTQQNRALAVVNELALAVNSSLDLQEIFTFTMQKLAQYLKPVVISLTLFDLEKHELKVNVLSKSGQQVSVSLDFKFEGIVSEKTIKTQLPTVVTNIINTHHAKFGIEHISSETVQLVPMHSREEIIGAVAIVGITPEDADWMLLNSASSIVAVAIENANLLAGTQQQVDDLIALNEISRALTSTLDLRQILKQTTVFVRQALQAEATLLWRVDENSQELALFAASGAGTGQISDLRIPLNKGILGQVAHTGESFISGDVSTDKNFSKELSSLINYTPRSLLAVPLQIKDKIIGVMQVLHRKVNWFDESHLRLAYPVVSSVGIAIENARLFDRVQNFSRQLEQMVADRTRELAEEKEKTEAILASMADGLLVLDADNRVLTANQAAEEMFSFKIGELAGKSIQLELLKNPLWRSINNIVNNPNPTVTALVDVPLPETGTILSTQAHSAKIYGTSGEVAGTVIIFSDITSLREVERIKARFMAGVTHELKTPLSVIHLHANNLLKYHSRLPDDKRIKLLNSIQSQSQLLTKLIESILDLLRLDAGLIEAKREPLDIVQVIDRIVTDLHPLAEVKKLNLIWKKPAVPVIGLAESDQIERVIRNLVDNAIKYTPIGGYISIEARRQNVNGQSVAEIKIRDNGIGIAKEHQPLVFDRFYRVDSSHTIPGTGLGLSIVKEIVNVYNGSVQLQSIPQKGSAFTVTLPAAN